MRHRQTMTQRRSNLLNTQKMRAQGTKWRPSKTARPKILINNFFWMPNRRNVALHFQCLWPSYWAWKKSHSDPATQVHPIPIRMFFGSTRKCGDLKQHLAWKRGLPMASCVCQKEQTRSLQWPVRPATVSSPMLFQVTPIPLYRYKY